MWQCLADLCNSLARVYDGEAPLYKADVDGEGDEELRVLQLEEDKMLAGFVPLLAAPQDPCYIDKGADTVTQIFRMYRNGQASHVLHHLYALCCRP